MSEPLVAFHPLSFVPEGEDVIVGRPDVEAYALFPADGAAALERLTQGESLADTATWYEARYGQPLDVEDFLATLEELDFVRPAGDAAPGPARGPVRFQRLGRLLFSPFAFAAYAGLFALWLITVLRHPQFAPHPRAVFFAGSILAVELVAVFGQFPFLLAHEAFHALAGRRLGLRSTLGVSHRLYFVVFETRMSELLTVPRRKRYLPYLAGMLLDGVLVCALGLVSYALQGPGVHGLLGRLALALAFPLFLRLIHQFVLFLQTDVYYVFATALGCHDLHAATRAVIFNRLWGLLGRSDRLVDESGWTERDLRVARVYAPFMAAGVCVLLGLWVFALVPVAREGWSLLVEGLRFGPHDLRFWDRAAFMALNLAQLGFLFWIARRNRRLRRLHPATAGGPTGAGLPADAPGGLGGLGLGGVGGLGLGGVGGVGGRGDRA